MKFVDANDNIKYIWDTKDGIYVYVYDYNNVAAKAQFNDETPRVYLVRQDRNGRSYFKKQGYYVYLDELEEYAV